MMKRLGIALCMVLAVFASGIATISTPAANVQNTPVAATLQPYSTADGARLYDFSPDGTLVAAMADDGQLCTYAVPSGEQIACADLQAQDIEVDQDSIAWAPDSSSFVFASPAFVYLIDSDIWQFDAQSGAISNLTDDGYDGTLPLLDKENAPNTTINVDVAPAWSADGSQIAFSRTIVAPDADGTPNELWTLDVASGAATKVVTVDPEVPGVVWQGIAWAPDGDTLYASYGYPDPDNSQNGVHAIEIATGDDELLAGASADFDGDSPMVNGMSPDGATLVVSYPRYLSATGAPASGYALLTVADGHVDPIVPPESGETDRAVALTPAFSPDGNTLIYTIRKLTTPGGLVIARDLATGAETTIATLPDGALPISLSPYYSLVVSSAGTAFVMVSQNEVYLVPVSGSDEMRSGHVSVDLPTPDSGD
jgi:Tol biopolymer transport system component